MTVWTVGQLVTAALMNSNVQALGVFLLSPPLAQMIQTLSQSVGTGAWTSILFDTNQLDSDSGHSTTTNTSRYVVQVPGTYECEGTVPWIANTTGQRGARISKNGTPWQGGGTFLPAGSTALAWTVSTPRVMIPCVAGDYLEVQGYQSSGGNLGLSINPDISPIFSVKRVSN